MTSRASSQVRRTFLGVGLVLLPALCLSKQTALPQPVTTVPAAIVPASGNASSALPAQLPLRRDGEFGGIGTTGYMLWLLLVVGAIAALGTLQLRRGAGPAWLMKIGPLQRRPLVKVVAKTTLGSGNSLHVVHWNGEELLLGCTAQSINVLGSRPAPAEVVADFGNARTVAAPAHPGAP